MTRSRLDYFVLDAISFDAEQLDQIVEFLNDPESAWAAETDDQKVHSTEIQAALMRLVKDKLIFVLYFDPAANDFIHCDEGVWPPKPIAELYFDHTGRGRVLYLNWDY